MSWKFTSGGHTYSGAAGYLRMLFSWVGLFIAIYILIGVFFNTASPHLPKMAFNLAALHSWVQYLTSIFFWPLSFWHPTFSVSQWPAGSKP